VNRYAIRPGQAVDLSSLDPDDRAEFDRGKKAGKERLTDLAEKLRDLQAVLYAERKRKLLVVLQAMDTGGKDGTIRNVFSATNPQGVRVSSFGVPSQVELAHDYLWRVHAQVPARGEIAVFNRSHYEDVLVVRVHGLVPEPTWRRRYDHINAFEQMLADEGTTIRKFFLHISRDEQKKRLQERLDDPTKRWKFNPKDVEERARWDDYMAAYTEVLSRTSTEHAPWYVVPGNCNWYRNMIVAQVLVDTLTGLEMQYPEPPEDLEGVTIP
jgi:PPK2 family polyphosphate:nucleotide phosphotransferase